jgi:UDP-3-O-[3-hydroxymyristoyl] N-acetylglucosamine deacetylase
MQQRTLKNAISAQGVGLHSGQKVTMTLCPSAPGTGIRFQRMDLPEQPIVPALWDRVRDTRLCTLIGEGQATIGTIEHVMSALRAAAIDNVVIQLDGAEVPIMDGSAEPFSFLIDCAGIDIQSAKRRVLAIKRAVRVSDGDKWAEYTPATVPSFDFTADFNHPAIGMQTGRLTLVNGNFSGQIARARTFGFLHEVEYLRANGLAKGGSLDNAIVLDHEKVMNTDGLRFDDEFVRHKILDAVGDLYLAGAPIMGHYCGFKAGHALNNQLLHAIFADKANYSWG